MTTLQDLQGRHAVITGGARGLGRAIANRLALSGASITVVDLDTALQDLPKGWSGFTCDLGAQDAQTQLKGLAANLDRVDIVVANAGVVPPWRRVQSLDPVEWQAVMSVNVWGVAATLGAFADPLAASGHGSAVVMASINGFRAHPDQMLYSASKHAVIGVMRSAALDLGHRNIRVNAIAPGPIATEALLGRVAKRHAEGDATPDAAMASLAAETALGRIATEADVANVAHFLASDASAGMTGIVLPVEAGLS